jgi:branched-chain amino acid transport system permease protein
LWFFRRSRAGRVLVATRENARAAQSFGVSPLRARLVGFAISGFVAALAGALLVFHQHALGRSYFLPEQSIRVFSMVVFGGLGSIAGVVLGAVYFTCLDYFVTLAQLRLLASGAGLLVALLLFPGGLGDLVYRGRDALLRARARSLGLIVPSLLADSAEPPVPPPVAEPVG